MRIVGDIPHPFLKITIFKMDTRFSVKFETGSLEQTYKFRDGEGVDSVEKARQLVTPDFLQQVENQFLVMQELRQKAIAGLLPQTEAPDFEEII